MRTCKFESIHETERAIKHALQHQFSIASAIGKLPIESLVVENGKDEEGNQCRNISDVFDYDLSKIVSEIIKILAYRQSEHSKKNKWNAHRQSLKNSYNGRFGQNAYDRLVSK